VHWSCSERKNEREYSGNKDPEKTGQDSGKNAFTVSFIMLIGFDLLKPCPPKQGHHKTASDKRVRTNKADKVIQCWQLVRELVEKGNYCVV
jgi:hypothetical protein